MPLAQPQPPALSAHHKAKLRRDRRGAQLDLFRQPRTPKPFTPARLTEIGLRIWSASVPVYGTLGERVFRDLRMETPGPHIVRFCATLKCGDERAPGLVWLLRDQGTGAPCGVLRVFLDPETGWAVSKKALGKVWGATVMPRPP
jgi:hypothetical protein